MESLPAAGTVRRTVRVAVALVVGQALLCALIGWLTIGRGHSPGSSVDQMAAPAVPPTVTSRYATPSRSAATTSRATASPTSAEKTADRKPLRSPTIRATSTRRAEPPDPAPPAPAPSAPAPASSEAPALPLPTIVATTTGPGPALAPPLPLPPSPVVTETFEPITVGDYCRYVGAYAITADGTLVRCVRMWRHRPRWKIV